jgi:hypothetical protein
MARVSLCLLVALTLTACGGDNPDRTYSSVTSATHDCGKEKKVAVNAIGGTFTFTGICERVSLSGDNNKVTIEATNAVAVSGARNVVAIGAVDRVSVSGSDNTVTWRKGLPGDAPYAATASGNNNSVMQMK